MRRDTEQQASWPVDRMAPLHPVERVTDHIERPSVDNRTYRVIRLQNKLEALIVHDPDTDKASAAMDVNVGAFSDEDDMPGMAHAVEHVGHCPTTRPPPFSVRCAVSVADVPCARAAVVHGYQEVPS